MLPKFSLIFSLFVYRFHIRSQPPRSIPSRMIFCRPSNVSIAKLSSLSRRDMPSLERGRKICRWAAEIRVYWHESQAIVESWFKLAVLTHFADTAMLFSHYDNLPRLVPTKVHDETDGPIPVAQDQWPIPRKYGLLCATVEGFETIFWFCPSPTFLTPLVWVWAEPILWPFIWVWHVATTPEPFYFLVLPMINRKMIANKFSEL